MWTPKKGQLREDVQSRSRVIHGTPYMQTCISKRVANKNRRKMMQMASNNPNLEYNSVNPTALHTMPADFRRYSCLYRNLHISLILLACGCQGFQRRAPVTWSKSGLLRLLTSVAGEPTSYGDMFSQMFTKPCCGHC